MERKQGEQSIQFDQAPFIVSHASVVGKKKERALWEMPLIW